MKTNCIICQSATAYLMTKDGYELFKCPLCKLVFVNPQPKPEFLKEKVYSLESGYQANKTGDFENITPDAKTQQILSYFKKLRRGGRLLDVGCSSGEFMYFTGKIGFETYGVELNKRTADVAKANGLNVFNGFLKDAKFENNFFDAIFLGDIIEHVNDPHDLIKECSRVLKKGGTIIISTPNLDCFWSKSTFVFYQLLKIPWSSVTPPYHLYQFSYDNLNKLMASHNFGHNEQSFMRPPRLMYELGSLHMVKRLKKNKNPIFFLYTALAFTLYTIFYGIDVLITPIKKKDFSMVVYYTKN